MRAIPHAKYDPILAFTSSDIEHGPQKLQIRTGFIRLNYGKITELESKSFK